MKLRVKMFCASVALSLTACATVNQQLRQFTAEDARHALAIAQASDDDVAAACYQAIIDHAKPARSMPEGPLGALSLFEIARLRRIEATEKVPEAVHIACAPLVVDAQRTMLSLGARLR
ncbi:MAG: hypothetical protein KDI55_02515 [Anaerolineae bacterium]|nr:hypothetical protein [Anaerolineae bacterium]MCP5428553.1 hypothetical protein [Chromatiaceae bacterium]